MWYIKEGKMSVMGEVEEEGKGYEKVVVNKRKIPPDYYKKYCEVIR